MQYLSHIAIPIKKIYVIENNIKIALHYAYVQISTSGDSKFFNDIVKATK